MYEYLVFNGLWLAHDGASPPRDLNRAWVEQNYPPWLLQRCRNSPGMLVHISTGTLCGVAHGPPYAASAPLALLAQSPRLGPGVAQGFPPAAVVQDDADFNPRPRKARRTAPSPPFPVGW